MSLPGHWQQHSDPQHMATAMPPMPDAGHSRKSKHAQYLWVRFITYSSVFTIFLVLPYFFSDRDSFRLSSAAIPPTYSQNAYARSEILSPGCDIFRGEWVYDASYPLYQLSSCPIVEEGFRCQDNGRPDHKYMKWRWQPSECEAPRLKAMSVLKRLQGLRIAFVGDSMGRTQWESLICILMQAVPDKASVYEINKNRITKRARYLAFQFSTHNLTIEYHRSPFLVQEDRPPRHAPKRVRSVLKLDKLDPMEKKWRDADVLIFNSGHWWNPSKTYQIGCYFQMADSLKLGMKVETAYLRALRTWALWVDSQVDTNKTRVFVRSFEPSHWEWTKKKCSAVQEEPNATSLHLKEHPQTRILEQVLQGMNKTVVVLNITALSDLRSDGHIGNWSRGPPPLDCSHWCLPGIPDTWNELLFISLFKGDLALY